MTKLYTSIFHGFVKFFVCSIAFLTLTSRALEPGSPFPPMQLQTLDNFPQENIQLHKLQGKVVYIDFWASWCGPCRKSFPVLENLHKHYKKQGFEVVGVNLDENSDDAKHFLNDFPVGFPLAQDPQGKSAEAVAIKGMPSAFILDRNGVVRHTIVGFNDKEAQQLETLITQLLKEPL